MNDNIYSAPESDAGQGENKPPNPLIVAAKIIGISIVLGLLIAGIEYLLGIAFAANSFLSSFVAAGIVGYRYGRKRGRLFTPTYRVQVVAIWLSILLSLAAISLLAVGLDDWQQLSGVGKFWLIFFAGAALIGGIVYLALRFGEKLAIRSLKRPE